jgi:hypothetical protein
MSFWIHALCESTVASVTPEDLRAGIGERLETLTYLFCPENEEDPEDVLASIDIVRLPDNGTFERFGVKYGVEKRGYVSVDRNDRATADTIQREVLPYLEAVPPSLGSFRASDISLRLLHVTEDVSFCLKARDLDGMGFPLAIAGAAYLVDVPFA